MTQEEQIIYEAGNGISTTTKFDYHDAANLGNRETPLLQNKTEQYGFVVAGSSLPSNPIRTTETTYLISDANYASVKSNYTNQNIVGLPTVSIIKDGATNQIVSRSEIVYDEFGNYPILTYANNPAMWQNPIFVFFKLFELFSSLYFSFEVLPLPNIASANSS